MSTHARPLADRLAAASDAQLDELLRTRSVRADADWDDFFDAAEALLESASIERGLAALSRTDAQHLSDAVQGRADAEALAVLAARGFIGMDGRVLTPVADLVGQRPAIAEASVTEESPSSEAASARCAERAFTTIGALADLLLAARTT
ncbi:MAG: hypothetical protein WBA87_06765, partial [Microbacterium sp.]